jgi:hypothetical protein
MHDVNSALFLRENKALVCLWSCHGRLWESVRSQCAMWWSEVWTVCRRSGTHGRYGSCKQSEYCVISDPLFLVTVVNTNASSILSKWTLQHKYTYEAYFYKTSFPIVLAYAITHHKYKVQQLHQKFSLTLENHLLQVSHMLSYQKLLIVWI